MIPVGTLFIFDPFPGLSRDGSGSQWQIKSSEFDSRLESEVSGNPLSFLFILARIQSIPQDIYEAAEIDGATPLQQFYYLSIPFLIGIIAVLFLLRFIWTFNKFDDIFLLTGGNAGTRTLTVNVYEQAFAISNLGAGAAVAVVIFIFLLVFSVIFIKFSKKEAM